MIAMPDQLRQGHLRFRCSRLVSGSAAVRLWSASSAMVIGALGTSVLVQPRPILLWNATGSSPVGFYAVKRHARLRAGDMAVAWAPARARRLAAERGYLPFRVPLVKRVAAIAGDRVCALHNRIFINGRPVARRRPRDPARRPMPWWSGCARLGRGDLFLLSSAGPLAFDGRYFGVTHASELVGRARPLWVTAAKGSRHG